jgi:hypothetical protein
VGAAVDLQTKPVGQSELKLHACRVSWQYETLLGVQLQSGGGRTPALPPVLTIPPVPGGSGAAAPEGAGSALPPELGVPPPLGPLPEQPQDICATQVKPSPQSEAVLQGSSYLGLHILVTTGSHAPGGMRSAGTSLQSLPGGHGAGAGVVVAQPLVSVTHTVLPEQSRSSVHGSATQP